MTFTCAPIVAIIRMLFPMSFYNQIQNNVLIMFLNLIGRKSGTIFLDQSHNEIKQTQRIHRLLSKLSLKYCPFCNGIFFVFFFVSPGMEINLPPSFSRLHRILVETSTLRCKFIAELLINFHSSRRFFPLTDFRQVLGSIFSYK